MEAISSIDHMESPKMLTIYYSYLSKSPKYGNPLPVEGEMRHFPALVGEEGIRRLIQD